MNIKTFGDKNKKVALLVHSIFYPGITSYRKLIPILAKDYYVVVPNLEGISYPHTDFVSTRYQAEAIVNWLKKNNIKEIGFLLGSSYGASVAFEILKYQSLKIKKAALDAPALKNSKIHGFLFYLELKKIVRDFKKKGKSTFSSNSRFKHMLQEDEEYCLNVFKNMDDESIKKLSYSCYDYTLPSQLYRKDTELVFLFGEKDKAKINIPEIKKLGYGEIRIIEGMDHMQYSFVNPEGFLKDCGLDI